MATYWLLGKADFLYKVDIQAAEELVNATEYWKCTEHSYVNPTFDNDDESELIGVVPNETKYRKN